MSAQHKDQLAANDVKWSHGKFDTTIATAAANGRIVLYDINRAGVELARLHEHTRQVHKVAFNPHQGALLLSGSQDATIRMWDVRDLAGERSVMTCRSINKFLGNNEGIRDLRWSPTDGVEFAAGTDNGVIQRWDFRKENAPLLKINAHDKTCHSIDWHPSGKFLASAGADRNVKVWDFKSADRRMKPSWQLRAPQTVLNVRWRPIGRSLDANDMSGQQCTHLATTYDQRDPRIHIWDFRRPHVPYLEIDRYDTPATGLLWCTEDLLWSVGIAGMFTQTNLKFATNPIERRNVNVVTTAPSGEICYFSKARARRPMALVEPPNGFLQRSNTGGSSGEKFGSSHSATDGSLEDTSILNSSLKKRRQKTLSTRTTSTTVGNTPPSAGRDMAAARLEEAMKPEGKFYPDQVGAYGRVLGVFDLEVFKYLARHYRPPLAARQLVKQSDMQEAILTTFEENARLAAYTGQYRLAQSWRILGVAVSNDIEKDLQNTAICPEVQPPTAQVIDVITMGVRHSNSPEMGQVQQTRNRSPVPSNFESTSNMSTPLAKPIQELSHSFPRVEGEMKLNDLPSTQLVGPAWKMHHTVKPCEDSVPVARTLANDMPSTELLTQPGDRGFHDNISESPDVPVIFGSFTDIDQQMSERRAAMNNYRAKPRSPLRLDDSSALSRSLSVAPRLDRYDSNESLQMFSASADSDYHSLTLAESFGESQLSNSSNPILEPWGSSHENIVSPAKKMTDQKDSPVENLKALCTSFVVPAEQKLGPPNYAANPVPDVPSTRRPSNIIPPIIHSKGPHQWQKKSLVPPTPIDTKALPSIPSISLSTLKKSTPWSASALLAPVVEFQLNTLSDTQFPAYIFLYLCPLYPHLFDVEIITTTLSSYHRQLVSLGLFVDAASLRNYCYPMYANIWEYGISDNLLEGWYCNNCRKAVKGDTLGFCERCRQDWGLCPICDTTDSPLSLPGYSIEDNIHSSSNESRVYRGTKLWAWCQECGHGGHSSCLRLWWADALRSEGGCPCQGCLHDCMPGIRRDERIKMREAEGRRAKMRAGGVIKDKWIVGESRAVERARGLVAPLENVPDVSQLSRALSGKSGALSAGLGLSGKRVRLAEPAPPDGTGADGPSIQPQAVSDGTSKSVP